MARTRSQAGKHAKTKGSSNERFLAKSFEKWWGIGKFVRTPASGGWQKLTGLQKALQEENSDSLMTTSSGDVQATDGLFPFHLEAKKQECWTMEGVFDSPKCPVWKWWKQAVDECIPEKKPMLIFTRNRVSQFCMLKFADIPNFVVLQPKAIIYRDLCIIRLKDLFELTDREYWIGPQNKDHKSNGQSQPKE